GGVPPTSRGRPAGQAPTHARQRTATRQPQRPRQDRPGRPRGQAPRLGRPDRSRPRPGNGFATPARRALRPSVRPGRPAACRPPPCPDTRRSPPPRRALPSAPSPVLGLRQIPLCPLFTLPHSLLESPSADHIIVAPRYRTLGLHPRHLCTAPNARRCGLLNTP